MAESHTGESEMIPLKVVGEGLHQAELGLIMAERDGGKGQARGDLAQCLV